jgi:hypothetical protein
VPWDFVGDPPSKASCTVEQHPCTYYTQALQTLVAAKCALLLRIFRESSALLDCEYAWVLRALACCAQRMGALSAGSGGSPNTADGDSCNFDKP